MANQRAHQQFVSNAMARNITEIPISNGSIIGIDTSDNLNATVPSDSFYPSSNVVLVV